MKKIGIIGAMDLEVEKLIELMDVSEKKEIAGNTFYSGLLQDKSVVVTCCGVGKVNAASSTQILISEFSVDGIINTGIAGGMHPEVDVCDIVISSDVTHHDVRAAQMKSCFPFVEYFQADDQLIESAVNAAEASKLIRGKHHVGRIVSGEAFIDNSQVKDEIISKYCPHCVEMEGSAIGHVAHINKLPFVVIRSISDNADDQANLTYKEFEAIAADQSSKIVLNMIKRL